MRRMREPDEDAQSNKNETGHEKGIVEAEYRRFLPDHYTELGLGFGSRQACGLQFRGQLSHRVV